MAQTTQNTASPPTTSVRRLVATFPRPTGQGVERAPGRVSRQPQRRDEIRPTILLRNHLGEETGQPAMGHHASTMGPQEREPTRQDEGS
jgi:hypothetical protein